MKNVISVQNLNKTYASGLKALSDVNLEIHDGEIFALLGPNGAGKTTLISIICGIVNPTTTWKITTRNKETNETMDKEDIVTLLIELERF